MLPTVILRNNFINAARRLLESGSLSASAGDLQRSSKTQRLTYNFGHSYLRMQSGDRSFAPLPDALTALCREAGHALAERTGRALPPADAFTNCIIPIYERGYQLQPHIDVDPAQTQAQGGKYAFYFGEDIIGVVLKADKVGGLYLTDSVDIAYPNAAIQPVPETDGTAYVLSGPDRHRAHGVSPIAAYRMSATFRTVHFC